MPMRISSIGIMAIFFVAILMGVGCMRSEHLSLSEVGHPTWSPSGEYQLHVDPDEQGSSAYFSLTNRQGEQVFRTTDQFDLRHNTYILWDRDNQVWVYSGDLGLFIWRNEPESGWTRRAYEKGQDLLPPYLQEHLDPSVLEVL